MKTPIEEEIPQQETPEISKSIELSIEETTNENKMNIVEKATKSSKSK